jgi:hypothetical protein
LELMQIWKCWYSHLHTISIEAELFDSGNGAKPTRTAVFFSGGIDSFFTLLRHCGQEVRPTPILIDDLLTVWGFDVPLQNAEAFSRVRKTMQGVAMHIGKETVDIATNLRETAWQKISWHDLGFGCALVSTALFLERRYSRLLIAGDRSYRELHPRGSHPLTDPLFSTGQTKVIHDGAGFNRVQKTQLVAESDLAMQTLRVCWRSRTDKNCGHCEKCYRTMITLELLGALKRSETFPSKSLEVANIRRIYCASPTMASSFKDVQDLAKEKGRTDIIRAIDQALKRSKRLNVLLPWVRRLRSVRFFWKFAGPLERALLAGSLR